MADENLFDSASNQPTDQNYLEQLVGDGKKYKDVNELAKAYAHANKHITDLSTDLTSLREFMTTQFEQLASKRDDPPNDPPVRDPNPNPSSAAPPKETGDEDLDARIAKILETRNEETRAKENARVSEEVLIERLGSKEAAVEAVRKKAEELGVSPQFLADTAFRSPKAFFNIMGVNPNERSRSTPNPSSDVNPNNFASANQPRANTKAFYDQLRKSDPKKYWHLNTQTQMMNDALRLGDDFFR